MPNNEPTTTGSRDLWASRPGSLVSRGAARIAHWRHSTWVLILTAGIGLTISSVFAWLASEVYEYITAGNGVPVLDERVLATMMSLRTPELNRVITIFTTSGGPLWMTIITSVVVLSLARWLRSWQPVVLVAIGVAGSLTITIVGKAATGRARPPRIDAIPPYESSASFPSGHSLNSIVITTLIVYILLLVQRRLWVKITTVVVGATYTIAMGLSRVYLGHHWFSDVVGAWMLGLSWAVMVITAHRIALTQRRFHLELEAPPDAHPEAGTGK